MKVRIATGALAVLAALLLLGTGPSATAGGGEARGDMTGTWFVHVPLGLPSGGLTGFYTFHRHGTLSGVVNTVFGGPPGPPGPPATFSPDNGIWRRVGSGFEMAVFRYAFDIDTGAALSFTRIRAVFDLDRSGDTATGEFFVAQWFCLMPTECPDPNSTDPDVPEFAPPPDNSFTMTRVRLQKPDDDD